MITPAYVRLMAQYNAEMNRRLYAAAARLTDAERKADRGAFWQSIHGTLTHLVGATRSGCRGSTTGRSRRSADQAERQHDRRLRRRCRRDARRRMPTSSPGPVGSTMRGWPRTWCGSAVRPAREMRRQKGPLVVHFFNHQTHHRGQAHALLTAAGQDTGDTDLFLVVPEVA